MGKLLYMSLKQELDQLLRSAIADKHLIWFQYRGKERIVEPHDYGVNNGIVRLFSWQVGGRSSGHLPAGACSMWKASRIARFSRNIFPETEMFPASITTGMKFLYV